MKNLIKVIAVVLLLATMTCLLVACKPSGTFKHEEEEKENGEVVSKTVSKISFKGNKVVITEVITRNDVKSENKTTYFAEIGDETIKLYTKKDKSDKSLVYTYYYTLEKNTLTLYLGEISYKAKTGGIEYKK